MNAKDLEEQVKNGENVSDEIEEENVTTEDVADEKKNEDDIPEEAKEEEKEETPAEEDASEENREEKKPFFKKKEKKDKKDEKIEELTDRVTRQMAEFDNFRKRTEKEKAQMFDMGARNMIEKMLPVIDNFERGFSVLTEEQKTEPFAAGMEKIYRQLMTGLAEAGLTEVEALGKEFDPELHNAVMHVDDEQYDKNIIIEVFQKGYAYKDTIIRFPMVKVAN